MTTAQCSSSCTTLELSVGQLAMKDVQVVAYQTAW